MRAAPFILIAALAACGAPSPAGDGGHSACAVVDSFDLCSADIPCCQNGYCDPVRKTCRPGDACGTDGQGCDDTHPCCGGLVCSGSSCVLSGNPTTTSGTGGNCQGASQPCGADEDCCFGLCAPNGLCASPTNGGNTTSGNTSTTGTNGGTCLNAGASCSSGTDCCSHRCSNDICG